MPKKGANISLSSYDDIFSTEESRADQAAEKVQEIPLSELHPFKNHPFKVLDDESMERTVESIRRYGVMVPAIARPSPDGGYEMISGHRRHHASELAGKETMPVIVREMDDDAATILMVDSRTNYAKEISSLIRDTYGGHIKVFNTEIPRSVRAAEISSEGKSIFLHDPKGKVAEAYQKLTKEVQANAEKRRKHQLEQLR